MQWGNYLAFLRLHRLHRRHQDFQWSSELKMGWQPLAFLIFVSLILSNYSVPGNADGRGPEHQDLPSCNRKKHVLIGWRIKGMFPWQEKRRHHHLLLQLCVRPLSRAIFNRTEVSFVNAYSLFCVKRIAEARYSPKHMFKLQLMVQVIKWTLLWLHLIDNQCTFIQFIATCCPTQLDSTDLRLFKSAVQDQLESACTFALEAGPICLVWSYFYFQILWFTERLDIQCGHRFLPFFTDPCPSVLHLESDENGIWGHPFAQWLGATDDDFGWTTPTSFVACTASWPCGGDVAGLVSTRSVSTQRSSL